MKSKNYISLSAINILLSGIIFIFLLRLFVFSRFCAMNVNNYNCFFVQLLSHVQLFESALLIRWPKYWSFSFSISPSSEYTGLIFLRIDWFDLLDVQGTLKSLLQHHSLKESILQHFAFFMVQLSQLYVTTTKTVTLTLQTFVGKVMSLL